MLTGIYMTVFGKRLIEIIIIDYDCNHRAQANESETLEAKERQELGRLRAQKHSRDKSIEAAIQAGRFCESLCQEGKKIFRKDLYNFLYEKGFGDLKIHLQDSIWKAFPEEQKNGPGKPKKNE